MSFKATVLSTLVLTSLTSACSKPDQKDQVAVPVVLPPPTDPSSGTTPAVTPAPVPPLPAPGPVAPAQEPTPPPAPTPKTPEPTPAPPEPVTPAVEPPAAAPEPPAPPPPPVPPPPSDDDRAFAPAQQALPTLNLTLDPATFTVPDDGKYARGAGKIAPAFPENRILAPYDGATFVTPACKFPVPFDSAPMSEGLLTIDGGLEDWDGKGLVGLDRAGDGFDSGGDTFDLREFHMAQDNQDFYLAFKFGAAWPLSTGNVRLAIYVRTLIVPDDQTSNPETYISRKFEIFDRDIYEFYGNNPVLVSPAENFEIAVNGDVMELRIDRSEFENYAGGNFFTIQPVLWNGVNGLQASKFDRMAPNILGLTDDYACLVPMPDNSFKMFPMRRGPNVTAETAEVAYRAMIAAAPADEDVLGSSFALWDTVPMTVMGDMKNPGLFETGSGLFLAADQDGVYEDHPVLSLFATAAHEYAHGYNAGDYALSRSWMKEGHSDFVARHALAAYYGPMPAHGELAESANHYEVHERIYGHASMDQQPWSAQSHGEFFFYAKASLFFDLLTTILPYAEIGQAMSAFEANNGLLSTDELLDRFTTSPSYTFETSPTSWNGWFDGDDYSLGILPKDALVTDADHDGLYAFEEQLLGLSDTNPDHDGDGYTDAFEVMMGMDPLVAEDAAHRRLAADGFLGDWDALLPGAITAADAQKGTDIACGEDYTQLERVGVTFDGDWFMVAAELKAAPGSASGTLVADVISAAGTSLGQFQVDFGTPSVHAFDRNGDLLKSSTTVSYNNGKTIELAYHRTWLGLGHVVPEGIKVRVATFVGNPQCSVAALRPPVFTTSSAQP